MQKQNIFISNSMLDQWNINQNSFHGFYFLNIKRQILSNLENGGYSKKHYMSREQFMSVKYILIKMKSIRGLIRKLLNSFSSTSQFITSNSLSIHLYDMNGNCHFSSSSWRKSLHVHILQLSNPPLSYTLQPFTCQSAIY